MKFRLVPVAFLLTVCALSGSFAGTSPGGAAPKPWTPRPGTTARTAPATTKPMTLINGIPDTGQYLPDTTWLIKVGPRITRVSDFVSQYLSADPGGRPESDSLGRVRFMTTLINHDLLGLTARALNRPLGFEDRATLREAEERTLSDVFFIRYVVDSARVSDAEVDEAVQQFPAEARFRRIVVADRNTAQQVRAALVSGKLKWVDAAKQYSLDRPTAQNPDGETGWVSRSDLSQVMGLPLFRLAQGEISQVIRSDQGYEISQLVQRRETRTPGAGQLRALVRRRVLAEHISILADSIQAVIRVRIGMVIDTANVRYASSRFSKAMSFNRQGYTTNIEISGAVPEFSIADTALVLARWNDGGQFTLGQFTTWYSSMNPAVRPNVSFPDGMMAQISSVVLEPYRATLARERGIDKDPEAIARIEGKRERLLVEHMYQDSVAAKVWASREERKAYYERHKLDYLTDPGVDFAAIIRHNRAGADSLLKALDAGAKPWDILAADSVRGEKTGSIQHRNNLEKGPYHKVLFEELRPGHSTIVGPDGEGLYAVIHLIHYEPGRQISFEDSQDVVDEAVQSLKSDELLNPWLERLRRNFVIESRPELVMRIRLVDPRSR